MPTKQTNRANHYWARIRRTTGRQRMREATDYIKALLADQPDRVVDATVEAAERTVEKGHAP